MTTWSWERDDFDNQGKLILLYRHQRFIDEGWIGKRVLDIGGWGKMSFRLGQEGREVIILNNWKPDLEEAKSMKKEHKFNGFELICADAHSLPFKNSVFNTVHSSETLEHVKSAERVSDEVFRVLEKEGIFCGTVPIPGVCHHKDEQGVRFFTETELRELLLKYLVLKLEETPSIKASGGRCSIMFVAQRD